MEKAYSRIVDYYNAPISEIPTVYTRKISKAASKWKSVLPNAKVAKSKRDDDVPLDFTTRKKYR